MSTQAPGGGEGLGSRLVLGTAQIGLPSYGIANRVGIPSAEDARRILNAGFDLGIRVFDTAQSYGQSEERLGLWLREADDPALAVITKLDPMIDPADIEAVLAAATETRRRLGRPAYGLLLHEPAILDSSGGRVQESFEACVRHGLATVWGVSVYTLDEFAAALAIDGPILIQAPFNVLDRRLLDAGLLSEASSRGKHVYLRSILLQGLLVLEPHDVPAPLAFAVPILETWRTLCAERFLDPLVGAIQFARRAAPDASIVVGCETVDQVVRNVAAFDAFDVAEDLVAAVKSLPPSDERLIDPRRWSQETSEAAL